MIRLLALILWGAGATLAAAQDVEPPTPVEVWEAERTTIFDAAALTLEDFMWRARPVVVFADNPNDPRYQQQLELLAERPDDLADRDVIVIVDTDPSAASALRTRLRPRGFMLVIMGKDGQVELRKPAPWSAREISRSIDKMPLRQQEVETRRLDR
ncbi:DUF4174 domain-containing protein [Thalassorhabdomicrobium marinisediminis]|uniref:DUF4174 domain-containing protein n=1 Tax=Thalassorhabdomicrobium marinisediminis TaxID=2170577 RepID=UPI002490CE09|nr:DUF4174 domain-containing protein [Thalassorhabdomicrobium marinisediminis]